MNSEFSKIPSHALLPDWYAHLLHSVIEKIGSGRSRAFSTINREVTSTYWAVGRELLKRESTEGWGSKIVTRLSADIRESFPEVQGFSPRNLRYMKSFAEAWPEAMLQQPVATLPWGHNVALLEKLSDPKVRLWYAVRAVEEGWSRKMLTGQIDLRLHDREGKAISNFESVMPPSTSDLVQSTTKDPYVFDFLNLTEYSNERDLERQLIEHVERFLLELGRGFAFVGRQIRLDLAGDEFFPDLLFYNFKLRRFVVIELKTGKFEPGFLGQLGMYMSAVDDLLAQPNDEPTIGLLLCKSKNEVVAEYALRGYHSPIGVAEWATELEESLPVEFARGLPTVEELEAELAVEFDDSSETEG